MVTAWFYLIVGIVIFVLGMSGKKGMGSMSSGAPMGGGSAPQM